MCSGIEYFSMGTQEPKIELTDLTGSMAMETGYVEGRLVHRQGCVDDEDVLVVILPVKAIEPVD